MAIQYLDYNDPQAVAFRGKPNIPLFTSLLPQSTVNATKKNQVAGVNYLDAGMGPLNFDNGMINLAGGGQAQNPYSPKFDLTTSLLKMGLDKNSTAYKDILGGNRSGGSGVNLDFSNIAQGLNPIDYSYLYDTVQGSDGVYNPSLTSKAFRFSDIYRTPQSTSDNYFRDYLGAINAPSSVDTVRSSIENELLQQTFKDIDQQTSQDVANLKLDFLDRGLGGPGQISDIEANALSQAYSGGTKAKTGARLNLALAELDRQKAREQAQREAFGQRYAVGAKESEGARDIAARGALADTQMLNELLGLEFKGGQSALDRTLEGKTTAAKLGSSEKMNLLNQLLNFALENKGLDLKADLTREGIESEEGMAAANRLLRQYLQPQSGGFGDMFLQPFVSGLASGAASGITKAIF